LAPPLRELADLALEVVDDRRVAGEPANLEQRGERVEIVVGERDRVLDGTTAVAGHEARIPQRGPQTLGHCAHRVAVTTATRLRQQKDVYVGARTQLPPSVRTEGHERDAVVMLERVERGDERAVDSVGKCDTERAATQREVVEQRGAGLAQLRRD